MNIKTKYQTNASGRSVILAKGHGRQVTVNFDSAKSVERNHGEAAGEFFNRQAANIVADPSEVPSIRERLAQPDSNIVHTMNDSGTVHQFTL